MQEQINDCNCVFRGALEPVMSLVTLKDVFYYGSLDGNLRSFNLETGKRSQILKGHTSVVTCLRHDSETNELFSSSKDKTIHIWNSQNGELINVIKGHNGPVNSFDIEEKNNGLFSGCQDGLVYHWNLEDLKLKSVYSGHLGPITCCIVKDGLLMSSSWDGFLKIVDLQTDKILNIFNTNKNNPIYSFTVNNDILYIGDLAGDLYTFNYQQDTLIGVKKVHNEAVSCVNYSSQVFNKYIFTGGEDKILHQLEIRKDNEIIHTYVGHTDSVRVIDINIENERLFTGSIDKSVRQWDVAAVLNKISQDKAEKKELDEKKMQEKESAGKKKKKKKKKNEGGEKKTTKKKKATKKKKKTTKKKKEETTAK